VNDVPNHSIGSDAKVPTESTATQKSYKTKLLEEYQDHIGGGGFTAWGAWYYSF